MNLLIIERKKKRGKGEVSRSTRVRKNREGTGYTLPVPGGWLVGKRGKGKNQELDDERERETQL